MWPICLYAHKEKLVINDPVLLSSLVILKNILLVPVLPAAKCYEACATVSVHCSFTYIKALYVVKSHLHE
jgi:hypothetical protein